MTPIIKNDAFFIRVLDENGNELAPTYIKRARGLVKKGRARFVGDDEIMLTGENSACPDIDAAFINAILPRKVDTKMDTNIIIKANEDMYGTDGKGTASDKELTLGNIQSLTSELRTVYEASKATDAPAPECNEMSDKKAACDKLSDDRAEMLKYVLTRIDKIIDSGTELQNTLNGLTIAFPMNDSPQGGMGDAARAEAVKDIVTARETTNQMLLETLRGMLYSVAPEMKPQADVDIEAQKQAAASAQSFELKKSIVDGVREVLRSLDPSSDGAYDIIESVKSMLTVF